MVAPTTLPLATWRFGVLALLTLIAANSGWACSVPVFRYALERWLPDAYTATVFHRGPLDAAEREAWELVRDSQANLRLVTVDLDATEDPDLLARWAEQETDVLPWLYVSYPDTHPVAVELASGPLDPVLAQAIVNADTRQELANRLATGETAVWVLLESGDASRDDPVWQRLQATLSTLENTLELPDVAQEDIDAGLLALEEEALRIDFSALRLKRDAAPDEMLVRMLLDTEEDLLDLREPMVFPIFGRGRVLHGLVGDGITEANLTAAAAYLTGACSCQVKAENPGSDLLMAMDWDAMVESTVEASRALPELAGILPEPTSPAPALSSPVSPVASASIGPPDAPSLDPMPVQAPASSPRGGETPAPGTGPLLWTTLGALLGLLLAVGIGGFLLQKPDSDRSS